MKKESKEKKVYLIASASFYPSVGGVETTLRGMTEGLVKDGHDVVIVSGDRTNSECGKQDKSEVLFGAQVYRYRVMPFFIYYLTCFFLLIKIRREFSFDMVISRSYPTTLCLLLAGYKNIKYLAPAVYANQNHPKFTSGMKVKRYFSYWINSFIERLTVKHLPEVYVFSSEMEEQIQCLIDRRKVIKIFPGVDRNRFYPVSDVRKNELRLKSSVPVDKTVLLVMGRLEKVKNPLAALKVLRYLPESFFVVFVGEGSSKKELIDFSISHNLQSRVGFFGFTSKPEEFYQLADAFLMTSDYEPFGQVILESFSSGLKVFGYKSSAEVNTATSEIFERLGVNANDYLISKSAGDEQLAVLIKDNAKKNVCFEPNVYGWEEVVYAMEGGVSVSTS